MKFGLFYLFSDFGNIPQDRVFREVLEEIEYAEELGFDSVWLPEHHFAIYGMLGNPMVLAAAIARSTCRMQIGTAIMVLPFQHPLRVAEEWFFTNARDRLLAAREQVDLGTIPEDYRYHYFDRFKEARFQFVADKVHGNTIDEMIDTGSACTGNPEDCMRTIEKYEAMGVDQFMACMQAGYTSHKDIMHSLELFGQYVIPHFRETAKKVKRPAQA